MIFHVDIDAFFASAEVLDHPEWQGLPVIVGALPGHRGVVSTCSYEARVFGVRSALPISKAYQLCPQGIYVLPRMARYQQLSSQVMAILRQAAPRFCQMSIDEAYLDLSGTEKLLGDATSVARSLKAQVQAQTGLTISIGIAPTYYLAKIASDYGKPNGLLTIVPSQIDDFMEALPLKKLHGAGGKTREVLERQGFSTVAQLRKLSLTALSLLMGDSAGLFLYQACRGQADYNPFHGSQSHSISAERTFAVDVGHLRPLMRTLQALCQEVIFRVLDEGMESRTLFLKLRWSDFTTISAQTTLSYPVTSSTQLFQEVQKLFQARWHGQSVRLMGVGLSHLVAHQGVSQGDLFSTTLDKQAKVEQALLQLRRKHPETKVTKASLLPDGKPEDR